MKPRPTNSQESIATIPKQVHGEFLFKSRAHEIFMETRPKIVVPIPLDMPGGCSNLNYSLYRPQLFTNSNVYLNCPIWHRPLEPIIRTLNDDYRESRREYFNNAYRIILEDMRDMNK